MNQHLMDDPLHQLCVPVSNSDQDGELGSGRTPVVLRGAGFGVHTPGVPQGKRKWKGVSGGAA